MKSLKDSKGKKFAISRFGSLSEFLTRSALRQAGVDPKDVTMLQIGATPARFTTLGHRHGRCDDSMVPGHRAGQGRRHE